MFVAINRCRIVTSGVGEYGEILLQQQTMLTQTVNKWTNLEPNIITAEKARERNATGLILVRQ